ncbi:MAG: YdcF family protein [Bacillota bacterium]|nr:YdcF family protein [Bacillota bacterium]
MKVSALKKEDLTADIIDKMLYSGLDDMGEMGDCIMVPGSLKAPKFRIPKAVSIYKDKRASKLLLSGGKIINTENGLFSEAELMRRKAIQLGIPIKDILMEETSMTTKENMLCALLILERAFKLSNVNSILLVTTSFHMRRCLLMAQTYMPDWIKFSPCPADDINTRRDNWYKNEKGYKRATEEAWKIVCYIREKSIPDFEI